jgi:hypothetical protein
MAMKRSGAAGGINSNKVTHREAYKTEPKARAVSLPAVSQIGSSLGNHSTDSRGPMRKQGAAETLIAGRGYSPPKGPTEAECKPGGGSTIHHCGTQSQHGPVAGQRPQPGRPIDGPSPFHNREDRS